jgi:hypothetical protein
MRPEYKCFEDIIIKEYCKNIIQRNSDIEEFKKKIEEIWSKRRNFVSI